MKTRNTTFTVNKAKGRVHSALFCEGTPFKMKVVASKVAFKRKQKHANRNFDQ